MAGVCGAMTRAGLRCRNGAMGAGFCRVHGGSVDAVESGALDVLPDAGDVAAIEGDAAGGYAGALRAEERDFFLRAGALSVSLDDEIALARTLLWRYVRAAGDGQLPGVVSGALKMICGAGVMRVDGVERAFDRQEIQSRAPDYADLILKMLEMIRKLVLARGSLLARAGGEAGDELGRQDTFIAPDEPGPDFPVL